MSRYTAPDFNTSAIITIDTQCDTLDGQSFEIPGTSAILPNMRRVLDVARAAALPTVHLVRIYKRDGSNVDICRRELVENGASLVIEGTTGCQLAPQLLPETASLDAPLLLSEGIQRLSAAETIIYKPRWSAFYNTPLEAHLRGFGVNTLIFMGCNFPNCPRTSIYDASQRDYRLVLVEDAVSGLYERGRQEMASIGVHLMTTDAVLDALRLHAASG